MSDIKIVTLYEFTQQGYEETQKSIDNLLASQKQLREDIKGMNKLYADNTQSVIKLKKEYDELNKSLNPSSTKAERQAFEELKKSISGMEGEAVRAKNSMKELTAQQTANSKQLNENKGLLDNYKRVLSELSKGMDGAKVSMNNLTSAQKYLQTELSKADLGSKKYAQLSAELASVTKTINQTRQAQQQQTKQFNVEQGSVEALRQKVSALKTEWKSLNQNSPKFAQVRDELKSTTDQLTAAEAQVGIFSRNVGNYQSAFEGLGGSLNSLIPGFSGVTGGFKAITGAAMKFLATPIGAVIGLLVAGLTALKQAFTRSAEGQEKFNKIMGALNGVMTVLMDTVADLGEFIISIFEKPEEAYKTFKKVVLDPLLFQFKVAYNAAMGVGKAIQGIFSKEARDESKQYFQNIKDDFNDLKQTAMEVYDGIKNKITQIQDKAKEGMEIGEMENRLLRERLKNTQILADNEVKISDLRNKAAQKDKLTNDERIKYLKEVVSLIKANSAIQIKDLTLQYEIQKAKNALGKTNQEDLQKEADLQAAITLERKRALDQSRELNAQIAEVGNATKAQYKTLLTERINLQKEMANAEAKVKISAVNNASLADQEAAKDELKRLQDTLSKKEEMIASYADKNIQFMQIESDQLQLLQLKTDQEVKSIRDKANSDYVTAYEAAQNKVREAQKKTIEAEKNGYVDLSLAYKQILTARQEDIKAFDEAQLIYDETQKENKAITDAEYQNQQLETYRSYLTSLFQMQDQLNQTEDTKSRTQLQKQISYQQEALNSLHTTLQEAGIDTTEVTNEVTESMNKIPLTLAEKSVLALNQISSLFSGMPGRWGKITGNLTKNIAKALSIDKSVKEEGAKISKFQEAVANAALSLASDVSSAITDIISTGIEQQRDAVDKFADFQLKRSQEVYDSQEKQLDEKLNKGEISEAKYKIEQIKNQQAQADKEKQIEERRANQQYSLDVKEFNVKKAQDLISAAINTALGITAAWANPFTAPAMIPIIAGVGAVQAALIASKKAPAKPKFAKGGLVDMKQIEGDRHSGGGVPVMVGNSQIAEVEGGEGALIISRKAMNNDQMKGALSQVASLNEGISGKNRNAGKFEEGGYMSFDDFYNQAYNSLDVKRDKRKLWVNGTKYKLPNKGRGEAQEAIMSEVAEDIANKQFASYHAAELRKLQAQEARLTSGINSKISNNSVLQKMGITDIAAYNNLLDTSNARKSELDAQISAYKELQEIRINDLKKQMDYDKKMQSFADQEAKADQDLETSVLGFNKDILSNLLESGQITKDEYLSYLDQIEKGYGATTKDIIALKQKEVEATKKLLEQQRSDELDAAQEVADFRTQALEQIREEWQANYESVTASLLDNISASNEAINQLTGDDLARYEAMLSMTEHIRAIDEETARLNSKYAENETELNDGVIRSREEQQALLEEQKKIQAEIALKEQEKADKQAELDAAKAEFEQRRADAIEGALKAFESNNFDEILAKVRSLGAELQEAEKNNLTLDKALAKELDSTLNDINASYDTQIAAQDAIIEGLEAQLDQLNLIHDKKVKDIEIEQKLFETNYNKQVELIQKAYNNATSGLTNELNSIQATLANLQIAGIQVGVSEYQKAVQDLSSKIDSLPQKYATGGAIDLGGGVYNLAGASHAAGGIPVSVGGTKIAEVEGGEKLFAINKMAAKDSRMSQALRVVSDLNKEYSGVPLIPDMPIQNNFELDYVRLAELIGNEINSRPQQTYVKQGEISLANSIERAKRSAMRME